MRLKTPGYSILGILFLLLMAALLWQGRKKIRLLQAWIWIAPFSGRYLLLVFYSGLPLQHLHPLFDAARHRLGWLLSHFLRSAAPAPRKTRFGRAAHCFLDHHHRAASQDIAMK